MGGEGGREVHGAKQVVFFSALLVAGWRFVFSFSHFLSFGVM